MSTKFVMVKLSSLRKTLVDDWRVRVAVVAGIAAVIGWELFVPVWLRFAVVMYAGWPVASAVVLAGVVGSLTLSWRHCRNTGILLLVLMMIVSVISIDGSKRRCTGYVRYGMDWVDMALRSLREDELSNLYREHAALDADSALAHMCFSVADWRRSWQQ